MGNGKYGEPQTALTGPSHIPFGLLSYSFLQGNHLPLLTIHPKLPSQLTPLPHLSGVCIDIQCLSVDNRGSEDLTTVLQCLKVGGCILGEVWDTNSCPLHIQGDLLAEGVIFILSPAP